VVRLRCRGASHRPQPLVGDFRPRGRVVATLGGRLCSNHGRPGRLAGRPRFAILRYRLYETELIINRTLVYGSLTATLVGSYFGGIVVFQRHFVVHTGEQSTLAVVASTLAIAALFNPLRRRVQGFVDRRFYRSKYDARETLEALLSLTTPPGCGGMVLVMESKGYERS
jgi:hypothetical protein